MVYNFSYSLIWDTNPGAPMVYNYSYFLTWDTNPTGVDAPHVTVVVEVTGGRVGVWQGGRTRVFRDTAVTETGEIMRNKTEMPNSDNVLM